MSRPITRAQREALYRVYQRLTPDTLWNGTRPSYLAFRRTVCYPPYDDCIMVPVPSHNIWLGIETDGYTHS